MPDPELLGSPAIAISFAAPATEAARQRDGGDGGRADALAAALALATGADALGRALADADGAPAAPSAGGPLLQANAHERASATDVSLRAKRIHVDGVTTRKG